MNMHSIVTLCIAWVLFGAGCSHTKRLERKEVVERDVAAPLDTLHDAAGKADAARYWSCFAPDAVFLGTDAKERWTVDEFKAYANPLFAQGKGWTYTVLERHIHSSGKSHHLMAWFDERLMNAKYGECRGTGVLVCKPSPPDRPDEWLIEQYNLTVPIPNDMLPGVADEIRRFQAKGQ